MSIKPRREKQKGNYFPDRLCIYISIDLFIIHQFWSKCWSWWEGPKRNWHVPFYNQATLFCEALLSLCTFAYLDDLYTSLQWQPFSRASAWASSRPPGLAPRSFCCSHMRNGVLALENHNGPSTKKRIAPKWEQAFLSGRNTNRFYWIPESISIDAIWKNGKLV